MEKDLKFVDSERISLVDFDRIIHFFGRILDRWKDKPSTYMRISNAGIGVPRSITAARELIGELGDFHELAYAAAYLPGSFYVKADFREGRLLTRCEDSFTKEAILELWGQTLKDVQISRDLLGIAIPLEGIRFVFSCLGSEGRLSETPQDGFALEKCYYLQYMNEIGMSHILHRLALFLRETQDSDGGWNFSPDRKSSVLSTANAILILTSVGEFDPVLPAVEFLMSRRLNNEAWGQPNYPEPLVTSIVCLSLVKSEKHNEEAKRTLAKVRDMLLEQSLAIENYSVIVDVLLQTKTGLSNQMISTLQERVDAIESHIESITNPEQLISVLVISLAGGRSGSDPLVKRTINRLIELRNLDGGWPSFQTGASSLYITVGAMVALKRVGYF